SAEWARETVGGDDACMGDCARFPGTHHWSTYRQAEANGSSTYTTPGCPGCAVGVDCPRRSRVALLDDAAGADSAGNITKVRCDSSRGGVWRNRHRFVVSFC